MDKTNLDELKNASPSEAEEQETKVDETKESEQNPLKDELEKVKKSGRTQKEKLLYTKKRIDEQLREIDKEEGVDITPDEDDDKPVTMAMLKQMQADMSVKTAIQLADDIEDETERELVRFHLGNTIKTTGNPKEDLRLAQALVNDVKNRQILEEYSRKGSAQTHSGSGSAPAKAPERNIDLTPDEIRFMQPPFNLTKDQIIASRKTS